MWDGLFRGTLDNIAALRTLGHFLKNLSYTTGEIARILNVSDTEEEILSNSGRFSLIYAEELDSFDSPSAVIARLFLLMGSVPSSEAIARLPPEFLTILHRLGLVSVDADDPHCLRGAVSIVEYNGRYFMSDPLFENRSSTFEVYGKNSSRCMPIHASSLELLSNLRPYESSGSLLDIGCGCGCQSILAGRSHEMITAIDVESRSVGFCRINAVLNDCDISIYEDRFETFRPTCRFDRIVFNAPSGGTVAFALIRNHLSALLSDRGTAQIRTTIEIGRLDHSLDQVIHEKIGSTGLVYDILRLDDSKFSLSPAVIDTGKLPGDTLVVDTPECGRDYIDELRRREIVEVATFVLNIQHHRLLER